MKKKLKLRELSQDLASYVKELKLIIGDLECYIKEIDEIRENDKKDKDERCSNQ